MSVPAARSHPRAGLAPVPRPAPVGVTVVAPRIEGVGILTGLAGDARAPGFEAPPADGGIVVVPTPPITGERFRRVTRECLLAVTAVKAAAAAAGLADDALRGERTGILFVSATAYAAANRAFLEDESSATLHFPYTSPSAVPGEVTIELGIRGPYVNLMGGGTATLQGLWYAARWLADGTADRVVLLAVEGLHEVRDLFLRAQRLYAGPLLEGAACFVLAPGSGEPLSWASAAARRGGVEASVAAVLDAVLGDRAPSHVVSAAVRGRNRALDRAEAVALATLGVTVARRPDAPGEALSCGPLLGLAGARAAGETGAWLLTAAWRDDYGAILWP